MSHRKYDWNRGSGKWRGKWYPAYAPNKHGVTEMRRWRPSMLSICERLGGTCVQYKVRKPAEQERYKNEFDGQETPENEKKNYFFGSFVHYPEFLRAVWLYQEGVDLIQEFREKIDLFTLAGSRREVSQNGIGPDVDYVSIAETFDLTPAEWLCIADSMPAGTWVRLMCERHAGITQQAAAE